MERDKEREREQRLQEAAGIGWPGRTRMDGGTRLFPAQPFLIICSVALPSPFHVALQVE